MSKLTKINVARLYNVGNYEHIRYEFEAEVREGEASKTFQNLTRIIEALEPVEKQGVPSEAAIGQVLLEIQNLKNLKPEEFVHRSKYYDGTQEQVIGRLEKRAEEMKLKRANALSRQQWALDAMENLGGVEDWKEVKREHEE